ncbi:hypothetical protein CS063_12590 [Sporanaerobium hydrogeniformans]|uniref:Uncharacterized protein n=1 Tax=Sporanaerobium hydrogeniformans TaxID=3072179 RepID=A0AC61D9N5_9FIRM|nr:sugar ABC transporter permease [Sporanaerobium hydrogeniformans]PHV69979.1 hypothetical protein CS063_12590 [Sporanaerobium hydrogeniformans]
MLNYKNYKKTVICFLLPALLFYTAFLILPACQTVVLSFFKWKGVGGTVFKFYGFKNYIQVFSDKTFWLSVSNLVKFLIISMSTQLPLGFILAYIISLQLKGHKFFKLSFFLPAVLSVTAISLMWRMILSGNYGLVNTFLEVIGLESWTRSWLTDPKICFTVICLINTWLQVGVTFVILLAGILNISEEMFEAAEIDGATRFDKIFRIIIPMTKDIIGICAILIVTNTMKSFDLIYVLTNGSFGPGDINQVPTGLMYITSFIGENFGNGSVIAVFIMIMGGLLSSMLYFKSFQEE